MMAVDDDHLNDCVWEDDDLDDEMAEAEMNCGIYPGSAGCSLAGTEWCDWNCPFSAELFGRRRKPKPAPLLDLMNKKDSDER